jgi:pimeloyl-ACP methyl ester carboxylesterase
VENPRRYGAGPFGVAILHGGPGAAGEMAPVTRELAATRGILEPLQTAATIGGQVRELRVAIESTGTPPLVLVGFSWGPLLGLIFAARHPALVKKLILISCPPCEESYAGDIMKTRLGRMSAEDRSTTLSVILSLDDPGTKDKNTLMGRLGALILKAESYDPLPHDTEIAYRHDIYRGIWRQARRLRLRGQLLNFAGRVRCPLVAIHGDYDPHPAAGAREPLSRVVKDFRFILLGKCDHFPWLERQARDEFYAILKREIAEQLPEETKHE